ncbi:MAG: maleylpyruvate isomerase family mycothiol-dependent enzyme, partial [Actinomycetes bacterium]
MSSPQPTQPATDPPADRAAGAVKAPVAAGFPAEETGLPAVRHLVVDATQKLLGDTITVSEEDWRAPSRLPGWSRGHVATHIARQADGMTRLVDWARTGRRRDMYASPEQRDAEIEAGAGRSGLDLQIDLDSSAGRLTAAFDSLDEADAWDAVVELRGGIEVPARLLPVARLTEVVLHHVDLGAGFEVTDIDEQTAEWLLEWCSFRLRARDEFPLLHLKSRSGFRLTAGSSGDPREVTGSTPLLLGWLTGRSRPEDLEGADGLVL